MNMVPVIGISCYVEPASWGPWRDVPAALLPHDYVRQVLAAGGVPVLVPQGADAESLISRVDALILAGGADIEPTLYGAPDHPAAQSRRPERDATEVALLHAAMERDLPVLGICRGMQLMAVAAGGSLRQHLPDALGHSGHSPGPGVYGTHWVTTVDKTRLRSVLGEMVAVSSYHHQSVDRHPGYIASGFASDGTLEAIEDRSALFRVGVQWHTEVGGDSRLFVALVAASRRDIASRSHPSLAAPIAESELGELSVESTQLGGNAAQAADTGAGA